MLAEQARRLLGADLDPADFYVPAHQVTAQAIMDLTKIGAGVDSLSVSVRLSELGALERVGGLPSLVDMVGQCPSTANAGTYAATIRDRAARRAALAVAVELHDSAYDLAVEVADTAEAAAASLGRIDRPVGQADPDLNIAAFLAEELDYRWLVPGLIERGDRLILTGIEGLGKSTLLRQLAVQFAAGIHPFRPAEQPDPVNVMVVDVENSAMQVQRKLRAMYNHLRPADHQATLDGHPGFDPDRLRINVRPQGIDLLARNDRRWFTERVDANRPDVVMTGPIYKLHRGKPTDEEPAAEVAGYLDDLRSRYDCALVIEAHSPHGLDANKERTLRPYGASLWMRWPEFGFGLKPDPTEPALVHWTPWRGSRDDGRAWPTRLAHGRIWPWVNAAGPPDTLAPRARDAVQAAAASEEPF